MSTPIDSSGDRKVWSDRFKPLGMDASVWQFRLNPIGPEVALDPTINAPVTDRDIQVPFTPSEPRLSGRRAGAIQPFRWLLPVACAALLLHSATRSVALQALADAYWQVASFVAATLWVFYALQDRLDGTGRLARLVTHSRQHQVLFSALLGVLPGCGGAIVVMTQFAKGRLSFGALVAVLAATMGDAAFLLLGTRPASALIVFLVCFGAGVVTGLIVDTVHESDFLRPKMGHNHEPKVSESPSAERLGLTGHILRVLLLPTAVISMLMAFQINAESLLGVPEGLLTVLGASFALLLMAGWAFQRETPSECVQCEAEHSGKPLFQRVADDCNSVLCWVIVGFLAFECVAMVIALDSGAWPSLSPGYLIAAAIAVGWVPGCGPQILTTSLYVSGALPLSAQIGNAISNDGDALFPAIALVPRAAVVATLYSSIPAFVAGYGYALLFE